VIKINIHALGIPRRLKTGTLHSVTSAALPLTFIIVAALVAALVLKSDRLNRDLAKSSTLLDDAHQVFVLAQSAETGQRGFLLTGQEKYLAPYDLARARLPAALDDLARLAAAAPAPRPDIRPLRAAVEDKLRELARTIALKRQGRMAEVTRIVASGAGYEMMNVIRSRERAIESAQSQNIAMLRVSRDAAFRNTIAVIVVLLVILVVFLAASMFATLAGLKERDRSVRQLGAAKFEADQANRAKSEFLASMSHELRTPLNAILGFSEVIQVQLYGPIGSSRYLEYAKHIHDSGTHLLDLINDILDLSKISAGKMEVHEREIAIPALIHDSLALVKSRAKEVKLEEQPSDGLPHIMGDTRLIKQILVNLLTNAIKFTPPGGSIVIGAAVSEAGIRFTVSDTGIGMSPADIEKALSEYGQVDSRIAREHQGTGLGLPICQSLAELHGGTLEIASKPGIGTAVTLVLPASRIVAAAKIQLAS
jgi:signal transduction histidine kinase